MAGNLIIIPAFYLSQNRSAATLLRSDTGVRAGTLYAEKGVSLDVAATPRIILLVSNNSGRSDNKAQLIAFNSITRKPLWQRKLDQSYCYEISIEPNAFALLLAVGRKKGASGEPARYEVLRLSTGGGKVLSRKILPKPGFNGVPRDVTKPLHAWFSGKLMANGGIYLERTTLVKQTGVVYVGIEASDSSESAIYAVSARTGEQFWRYPLLGVKGLALEGTTLIATYQRSPWEMDESVRSAQGMIGLIALDSRTRQKLWEKTVLGGPM